MARPTRAAAAAKAAAAAANTPTPPATPTPEQGADWDAPEAEKPEPELAQVNEAPTAEEVEDATDADPAPVTTAKVRTVRVRCISIDRPWTDKKPLNDGEEADVPVDVAELMEKRGQVEIL